MQLQKPKWVMIIDEKKKKIVTLTSVLKTQPCVLRNHYKPELGFRKMNLGRIVFLMFSLKKTIEITQIICLINV